MAIPIHDHRVDDLTDEDIDRMVERHGPPASGAARECPRCGAADLEHRLGGEIGEVFVCRQCGYEGSFVLEAAS